MSESTVCEVYGDILNNFAMKGFRTNCKIVRQSAYTRNISDDMKQSITIASRLENCVKMVEQFIPPLVSKIIDGVTVIVCSTLKLENSLRI